MQCKDDTNSGAGNGFSVLADVSGLNINEISFFLMQMQNLNELMNECKINVTLIPLTPLKGAHIEKMTFFISYFFMNLQHTV